MSRDDLLVGKWVSHIRRRSAFDLSATSRGDAWPLVLCPRVCERTSIARSFLRT